MVYADETYDLWLLCQEWAEWTNRMAGTPGYTPVELGQVNRPAIQTRQIEPRTEFNASDMHTEIESLSFAPTEKAKADTKDLTKSRPPPTGKYPCGAKKMQVYKAKDREPSSVASTSEGPPKLELQGKASRRAGLMRGTYR